jgi:hypothetical protein
MAIQEEFRTDLYILGRYTNRLILALASNKFCLDEDPLMFDLLRSLLLFASDP